MMPGPSFHDSREYRQTMQNKKNNLQPKLVAHRGYAEAYPENSLSAFQAAVDCGARYLELDVQLTRDQVPIILHDATLQRTSSQDINVFDADWAQFQQTHIGEPQRFGEQFKDELLLSLAQFAHWLVAYPSVKVFVEIKEESIQHFGKEAVLAKTLEAIAPIHAQCFLISFDACFLFYAKQQTQIPLGFILREYNDALRQTAINLQPDVLISNYTKLPETDGALWPGPWEWFLYEVTDPALAQRWHDRGATYIETMEIKPMLEALTTTPA